MSRENGRGYHFGLEAEYRGGLSIPAVLRRLAAVVAAEPEGAEKVHGRPA